MILLFFFPLEFDSRLQNYAIRVLYARTSYAQHHAAAVRLLLLGWYYCCTATWQCSTRPCSAHEPGPWS